MWDVRLYKNCETFKEQRWGRTPTRLELYSYDETSTCSLSLVSFRLIKSQLKRFVLYVSSILLCSNVWHIENSRAAYALSVFSEENHLPVPHSIHCIDVMVYGIRIYDTPNFHETIHSNETNLVVYELNRSHLCLFFSVSLFLCFGCISRFDVDGKRTRQFK